MRPELQELLNQADALLADGLSRSNDVERMLLELVNVDPWAASVLLNTE